MNEGEGASSEQITHSKRAYSRAQRTPMFMRTMASL
jgi:hypothetical protein